MSDACIISSIRDGLNLVSYEYAACQVKRKGVLMLSSYAGAVKTLPVDSCLVLNPWDTPRFAEKINQALSMSMEERERRHGEIFKVVETWSRSDFSRLRLRLRPSFRLTRSELLVLSPVG